MSRHNQREGKTVAYAKNAPAIQRLESRALLAEGLYVAKTYWQGVVTVTVSNPNRPELGKVSLSAWHGPKRGYAYRASYGMGAPCMVEDLAGHLRALQ